MGSSLLLHGRNEFPRLAGMQIFEIGCLAILSNRDMNPKFLSSTQRNESPYIEAIRQCIRESEMLTGLDIFKCLHKDPSLSLLEELVYTIMPHLNKP